MKKSDLCQIADLFDERLDLKFDEKLKGFATKTDLGQFATKDDLKSFATKSDLDRFATKDDLENSLDRALGFVKEEFDKNTKEHNKMFSRLDKIEEKIIQQPTKSEIFDKWDNNILQMSCDVNSLKYLHKDEWGNLPSRSTIKI